MNSIIWRPRKNYRAYGQSVAPDYPIQNIISRNIAIFIGPNDSLATRFDQVTFVSNLRGKLTQKKSTINIGLNDLLW